MALARHQKAADIVAQIAVGQVAGPSGSESIILAGEFVESPDSRGGQAVEEGVLPLGQWASQIGHGDGQAGAEAGDIVAVKVDVKMGSVGKGPDAAIGALFQDRLDGMAGIDRAESFQGPAPQVDPVAVGDLGQVIGPEGRLELGHGVGTVGAQSVKVAHEGVDPGEDLNACPAAGRDDAAYPFEGDEGVVKGADGDQQGLQTGRFEGCQ